MDDREALQLTEAAGCLSPPRAARALGTCAAAMLFQAVDVFYPLPSDQATQLAMLLGKVAGQGDDGGPASGAGSDGGAASGGATSGSAATSLSSLLGRNQDLQFIMDIAEGAGLLPATGDSGLLLVSDADEDGDDGEGKTEEAAESKTSDGPAASGAGASESKGGEGADSSEEHEHHEEEQDPATILAAPLPSLLADLLGLVKSGAAAAIRSSHDAASSGSGRGFSSLHKQALDFFLSLAQVAAAGETRFQVAGSAKGAPKTIRVFPSLVMAMLRTGVQLQKQVSEAVTASLRPGAVVSSGNPGDLTPGQESALKQAILPLLGFAAQAIDSMSAAFQPFGSLVGAPALIELRESAGLSLALLRSSPNLGGATAAEAVKAAEAVGLDHTELLRSVSTAPGAASRGTTVVVEAASDEEDSDDGDLGLTRLFRRQSSAASSVVAPEPMVKMDSAAIRQKEAQAAQRELLALGASLRALRQRALSGVTVLLGQLAGAVAHGKPAGQVAEAMKLSVLGGGIVSSDSDEIVRAASGTTDGSPAFLDSLVPPQPTPAARQVLHAVATGSKQHGGVALAKRLDKIARVRGRDAHIRKAGRAAGAAAILHSGLAEEAAHLARVARAAVKNSDEEAHFTPSKEMQDAWRQAQEIRSWISLQAARDQSEVRAVVEAQQHDGQEMPLGKEPQDLQSLTETRLAKAAQQRALLLLDFAVLTASPTSDEVRAGWAETSESLPRDISSRTFDSSERADSPLPQTPTTPGDEIAHAESAAAVGSLLAFERAMAAVRSRAAQGQSGRVASPAEQVVTFMRYAFGTVAAESGAADPLVAGVKQLCKERDFAAQMRATGFAHVADTLEQAKASGDEGAISRALLILAVAMRSARANSLLAQAGGDKTESAGPVITAVHALAGLEGCSPEARRAMYSAQLRCLRVAIEILRGGILQDGKANAGRKMNARRVALMVLAQDYNIGDIPLIHEIRLLPTVRGLLKAADAAGEGEEQTRNNSAGAEESKESSPEEDGPAAGKVQEAERLAPQAAALLRVLTARLVGLDQQTLPAAVASAAATPAELTIGMQRDLLAETHARLAHACDLLAVKVAKVGMAASRASSSGGAVALRATSAQPSMPAHLCPAVTYIDGTEAVPIFADASTRVLPGAGVGRVFSMGMWVYAPIAAPALQEPLATASKGMVLADQGAMQSGRFPLKMTAVATGGGDEDEDTGGVVVKPHWTHNGAVGVSSSQLSDGNRSIKFSSSEAARFVTGIKSGLLEWELDYTDDSMNDEGGCIGVGPESLTGTYSSSSKNYWCVRCYNGQSYHPGGSGSSENNRRMHPDNGPIKFQLEMFDGKKPGVFRMHGQETTGAWDEVFTDLPKGQTLYPLAASYSSPKFTIKSIKYTPFGGGGGGGLSQAKAALLEQLEQGE